MKPPNAKPKDPLPCTANGPNGPWVVSAILALWIGSALLLSVLTIRCSYLSFTGDCPNTTYAALIFALAAVNITGPLSLVFYVNCQSDTACQCLAPVDDETARDYLADPVPPSGPPRCCGWCRALPHAPAAKGKEEGDTEAVAADGSSDPDTFCCGACEEVDEETARYYMGD